MAKRKPRVDLSQPMSEQPWYVRALVWVGAPTAAAAYLLWWVLGNVDGKIDRMTTAMDQQQKNMAALITNLQQETEQSWVMQGTLSRICINTARTDADKIACVSVARRPQ